MRHGGNRNGFTTIELVTVVFILAVVAGSVIAVYGPEFMQDQETTATRFEMQELRKALLRFRTDNMAFPSDAERASPADHGFLFAQGALPDWNPDYKTGWRGPYLPTSQSALVDVGDNLGFDGSGAPHLIDSAPANNVRAVADAYTHFAVDAGTATASEDCGAPDTDGCLLEWRGVPADAAARIDRNGRPYFLFELDNIARARIVSSGPDGIYDGVNGADVCQPNGDDHVLCLF